MKIPEFGTLELTRTNQAHFGHSKITSITQNSVSNNAISKVNKVLKNDNAEKLQSTSASNKKTFQDYILEAINTVNTQQLNVSNLQEKLITEPDSVDIHDVAIAMSKARMSMNLAQTVIDRLVSGWNEITTTR